jgi:hypothetical protein
MRDLILAERVDVEAAERRAGRPGDVLRHYAPFRAYPGTVTLLVKTFLRVRKRITSMRRTTSAYSVQWPN